MMIKDDVTVEVQNLTGSVVSYMIPETNHVRHFEGQQTRRDITAGELRKIYATKGGRALINDYLAVKNKALADEFNIATDAFEHEYSWTQKEVDTVLKSGSLEALQDALEFGPQGIKDLIVDRALALKIPDNNKLAAIQEFTGRDVANMIKLDTELDDSKNKAETSTGTRRVVPETPETASKRRVSE